MHAFLITGGSVESRNQHIASLLSEWKSTGPDVHNIEPETEHISIAQIREVSKRLLLSPMQSPIVTGVIRSAHTMTTEAQNALLKLLEEPPLSVRMILETAYPNALLETVLSRCQHKSLGDTHEASVEIQQLLDLSSAEWLKKTASHAADRSAAKQWLMQLLLAARKKLLTDYSTKTARTVRNILIAQRQLDRNCNVTLTLDCIRLDD